MGAGSGLLNTTFCFFFPCKTCCLSVEGVVSIWWLVLASEHSYRLVTPSTQPSDKVLLWSLKLKMRLWTLVGPSDPACYTFTTRWQQIHSCSQICWTLQTSFVWLSALNSFFRRSVWSSLGHHPLHWCEFTSGFRLESSESKTGGFSLVSEFNRCSSTVMSSVQLHQTSAGYLQSPVKPLCCSVVGLFASCLTVAVLPCIAERKLSTVYCQCR